MRRPLASLIALVVLGVLLLWPALTFNWGSTDDSDEPTSISDYRADFTVAADGDLTVVETLTVDVPVSGRHGIFRYFDVVDQSAPYARRIPDDITVTRDGVGEEHELLEESKGRYRVAKIGNPYFTLLPGEYVYRIGYRIPGVLQDGADGVAETRTELFWNLIPGGWRQDIGAATLTVHLPEPPVAPECYVGVGANDGCTAKVSGNDLTVRTGPLPAYTPVTLRVGQDMATPPPGASRLWAGRLDPVLGPNAWVLGLVLLVAAGAGLLGARSARSAFEPTPSFPLMYAPPDGIGPAQAAYLFTGIDVQLTRRAELIPNLVSTVQGYAAHEKSVFEEVTRARAGLQAAAGGDDVAARAAADAAMQQALVRVNAVAEQYPDLEADQNFLELQRQLAETEDQLSFARQYYNDALARLNTMVRTVPWMFLTGLAGVHTRSFYEAPTGHIEVPTVRF